MREIKFRAIRKTDNKIFEVMSLDIVEEEIMSWDEEESNILYIPFDKIELMQYTGLKDKNGVEIYEGDVVKFDSSVPYPTDHTIQDGDMGIVSFELGCFGIKLIGVDTASFYLNELGDWVVVGNIYENPELLEELK